MQIIDYDAIVKNAQRFKQSSSAKLCAVVKCNAYGHGLTRVAGALRGVADMFAVGNVEEAKQIDCFGTDVLVLLPSDFESCKTAVRCGYILTADSFDTLDVIVLAAKAVGQKARVHIKIDSGMHRLGFFPSQVSAVTEKLLRCEKYISVEGVFSHFASTDCDANYTERQFEAFLGVCKEMSAHFDGLTRHIANTAAASCNKYCLDMVRIGLGLYGYGGENLLPAKIVTTKVIAVKPCAKGEKVSYCGTFTAQHDTNLAVLNIGYNDGLPRELSGKATVFLHGETVPVVGNVCMAMCMADIGDLPVRVGEEAEILGRHNSLPSVSVYQLLCNLR